MYFSLTFEREVQLSNTTYKIRKNTYDDWRLIPMSRPVIAPPEQKTELIEIPYSDGSIDMSTALNGYPTYQRRTGSIQFLVEPGYKSWIDVYNDIVRSLHGYEFKVFLEEEPDWYYYGRINVDEWSSEERYSTITLNYDFEPYKKFIRMSDEDFVWDTFNFDTGIDYAEIFTFNVETKIPYDYIRVGYKENDSILLQKFMGDKPVINDITLKVKNCTSFIIHFNNFEISNSYLDSGPITVKGSNNYINPDYLKFTNKYRGSLTFDPFQLWIQNQSHDTDHDDTPMSSTFILSFRMEKL